MKKHYLALVFTVFVLAACGTTSTKRPAADPADPPIFVLIDKGKTQEAKALVLDEASSNVRDSRGRTPLHAAAQTNNAELVRFLLAMGAEPDLLNDEETSPLGISARLSNPEITRLLAGAGADIHRPLSAVNPDTPALLGVRQGGGLLDALLHPKALSSKDSDGLTLLHLASRAGKADAVALIIAAQAPINERDNNGKTALDYAFDHDLAGSGSTGYAEAAEKLVLAGGSSSDPFYTYFAPAARTANYNIRITDGYTALHYAAYRGYPGYIDFIAGKNANLNIKNNSGAAPLHEAYREGRLEIVEQLISLGADVNEQDAKGNTPLHLAAPVDQHEQAIDLLLANEAKLNLRDEHGETPLHVIIALGRSPEIVSKLLENDADIAIRNIEGKTPLYLAVENKRADLIPMLLERGSDIFAADNNNGSNTPLERAVLDNNPAVLDVIITPNTTRQSDSAGNTPLHVAVRNKGDIGMVELILNRQGEVNARNKEGNTALHLANMVDHEAAGTLLISRGGDIFGPNSKGESPLYLAFTSPGPVREWMLIPTTLDAKDGLENTALHYAAQWKLAAHIPLLVRKGSKLEAPNAMKETPLFMAARANSPQTIQALLAAGASINARDAQGNSPLHIAIRWDAKNSIDPLISAGNSINAQNLAGKSPLHEAVRLGLTDSEIALLERKANIEIRDIQGNTPLIEAIQSNLPKAGKSVERLAYAGADTVTRNNTGDTPLHIAVSLQRMELVILLLNYGVPIHARNSQGITPFQIALSISPTMVSTLLTKDRVVMSDDHGLSPLHIALKQQATMEILKTILDRGSRVSAVDSEGRTPLRLALDLNALEGAKMLADAGSDVFAPAADGKTPTTAALGYGEKAVRALFSGNSVNARDSTGNTVLHYAAQAGNPDLITVLLELGANKATRNIASESPADIAQRWKHERAAALLQ